MDGTAISSASGSPKMSSFQTGFGGLDSSIGGLDAHRLPGLGHSSSSRVGSVKSLNLDMETSLYTETAEAESLSQQMSKYDQLSVEQEKKSSEMFHMQMTLFREQISVNSKSIIELKTNVGKLQELVHAETRRREALGTVVEEEKRERASGDEKLRASLAELDRSLEVERSQRTSAVQLLEQGAQRMQAEIEEEAKKRMAGDGEALSQSRSALTKLEAIESALRSGLQDEAAKRKSEIAGFSGAVHSLRADLDQDVSRGTRLSEQFGEFKVALDKERGERELGDQGAKTLLVGFQQALAKEREERMEEDAALRRGVQDLPRIAELKRLLDEEAEKRFAADQQLDEALSSFRAKVESELAMQKRAMEEAEQSAQTMGQRLDQEGRKRAEDLRAALEKEASERGTAFERLEKLCRDLRGGLDTEASGRAAAVEELSRSLQARLQALQHAVEQSAQAVKAEETSRIAGAEKCLASLADTSKRLTSELELSLEREARARERGDEAESEARGRLLAEEASARTHADSALEQRTAAETRRLEEQLARFEQGLEREAQARAAGAAEASQSREALAEGFAAEVRKLQLQLEAENKQRATGQQELEEKLRAEERSAADRIRQCAATAETALRTCAESLEEKVSHQVKVLTSDLQAEVGERKAGDERLERRQDEISASQESARTRLAEEFGNETRTLRQALDAETRTRAEEDAKGVSALQQFQHRVDTQCGDLSKQVSALSVSLDREAQERAAADNEGASQMRQASEKESRARAAGDEDLQRRFNELAEIFGQERALRETAEANARSQLQSCRQDLMTENEARANECADLRQRMQAAEVTVKGFNQELQAECETRAAADERLDKRCAELRSGLDAESASRSTAIDDLGRGLRALRQDVDQEVKQRSAEDESLARSLAAEVQQLGGDVASVRAALDAESRARAAGDDAEGELRKKGLTEEAALRQRGDEAGEQRAVADSRQLEQTMAAQVESLRRMGEEEATRREQGDLLQSDQLGKVRTALDLEGKQRLDSDRNLEDQLHDQERVAVERITQSVAAAEGVLRGSLMDLEGQIRELEARLRQDLSGVEARVRDDTEHKHGALTDALGRESEARGAGDEDLRQQLEGWHCKEAKADMQREKAEREQEDASLREMLHRLEDNGHFLTAKIQGDLREARAGLEDQLKKVWKAVNDHTHDMEVEETVEEAKTPKTPAPSTSIAAVRKTPASSQSCAAPSTYSAPPSTYSAPPPSTYSAPPANSSAPSSYASAPSTYAAPPPETQRNPAMMPQSSVRSPAPSVNSTPRFVSNASISIPAQGVSSVPAPHYVAHSPMVAASPPISGGSFSSMSMSRSQPGLARQRARSPSAAEPPGQIMALSMSPRMSQQMPRMVTGGDPMMAAPPDMSQTFCPTPGNTYAAPPPSTYSAPPSTYSAPPPMDTGHSDFPMEPMSQMPDEPPGVSKRSFTVKAGHAKFDG